MMDRRSLLFAFIAIVSLAASPGCEEESAGGSVTYYEHVRPVIAEHCSSCHAVDSIAPFALDTYEQAVEWGGAIVSAVEARRMPPFNVNNDGSCNTFANAKWLSASEIAMFRAWADGGYAKGDATLPAPPKVALPELGSQGVERVGFGTYTPSPSSTSNVDDYRCFEIPLALDEDRFLTGYDVAVDNDSLVHHVVGFRVSPDDLINRIQMDNLDAQYPGLGWGCYGAAGENISPRGVPITWAPGGGSVSFPEGTGIRFEPGDVLVLQIHYFLPGGAGADATKLDLQWASSVEREAFQLLQDPFLFSILNGSDNPELPPGQRETSYPWSRTFNDMLERIGLPEVGDIDLWSFFPHMHTRGRRLQAHLGREEHDTTEGCVADVDRWDFNWQSTYFFEHPVAARGDQYLSVECAWDTSGDTTPTLPGFGSEDEMCLVGILFTERE